MTRYPGRERASEIVLRGSGARFLAVAVLIAAVAAAAPAYLASAGVDLPFGAVLQVWLGVLAAVVAVGLVSGYYYSRRLTLGGGRLRFWSWTHDSSWPVSDITDVSYQNDLGVGESPSHRNILVFWCGDRPVLRIDASGWPREELGRLLRALKDQNPDVSVAPEASRLLQS